MRVAFIQQSFREQFGVMYLSAMLKRAGHETDVFIYSKGELMKAVEWQPDVFAITSSTPTAEEDLNVAESLKYMFPRARIIMGGPHPTFYASRVMKHDCISAICVGEGYEAIVEFVERPGDRTIRNLCFQDGTPNEIRPIYDIDKLPAPDYDIYYRKYPELAAKKTKQVYIVRGCPYQCAFCYNPVVNGMYQGKGKIVQHMNIDKVMAEIRDLKERWGFTWLQFISDTMNMSDAWFLQLVRRIHAEIGTRYLCNVRLNLVTEEQVKTMAETGCDRVDFGVEHGDDWIRNHVLKRNMAEDMMVRAGRLFKKYGIRVQTTNIVGLPYETLNKAVKTVFLNQKLMPEIAKACVLQPFEGTAIYDYAAERGLLQNMDMKSGTTYQSGYDGRGGFTKIRLKDARKLVRLSYLLDWFVQHPWLNAFIKIIVSLPLDRLYRKAYQKAFARIEEKYT